MTTNGWIQRAFCVGRATCSGPNDVRCKGSNAIQGCLNGGVVAMTCDAGTECREYATLEGGHEAECVVR